MKKAKIILSAVALLAVLGGAFAFKAMRIPGGYWTYDKTTATGTSFCYTVPLTSIDRGLGTTLTSYYVTTNLAGHCIQPTTTTVFIQNPL